MTDTILLVRGQLEELPEAPHLVIACALEEECLAVKGVDAPILSCIFSSGEPRAELRTGTVKAALPATPLAAGVFRVACTAPELDVIAVAAPWDQPALLPPLLRRGRRSVVVSLLGLWRGRWCDGPLAHATAAGLVASYLPAGGEGALGIPLAPKAEFTGISWDHIDEGTDRLHRCLLGRVRHFLRTMPAGPLVFALSDVSLGAAAALVLVRQARPDVEIGLKGAAETLPPTWRRLCQNIGVRLVRAGAGVRLEDIQTLLPPEVLPDLIAALNSISDVIPKTLR